MALTMQKTKAIKVHDHKNPEAKKQECPNCPQAPNQKIELKMPLQMQAAMGLGIGGNDIMSKPQTMDQISAPVNQPIGQPVVLSERDFLKMLEEV